jgi:UDP:flavonoid glycosyltransferase YjiC (YdhE family)
MPDNLKSIACFISPHGFGHAARSAAVMEALQVADPALNFEIFTKVPVWFFEKSLSGNFRVHSFPTDIGLAQKSPFVSDLSATLERLNRFLPFDQDDIKDLAREVRKRKCCLVLCDIAPLGIAVAREAGVPSVLIENFTWDWIYEPYAKNHIEMQRHIEYLRSWFERADFHIQTEPVCDPAGADITTGPVSREARAEPAETRKRLNIPIDGKVIMMAMGGIPGQQYAFLDRLEKVPEVWFVVPGAVNRFQALENVRLLPNHSDFFHPDLVHASEVVIGKAGYSTLAEVYAAGVPFGYIMRKDFRESPVLGSFIETRMKGLALDEDDFLSGAWLSRLPELLGMVKARPEGPKGAVQAARFIMERLA